MALTELKIKRAAARSKVYKLSDGNNLVLVVRPTGSKTWKQRVYRDGKERDITLGTYPAIGLAAARQAAAEALDAIASGVDPVAEKRRAEARAAVVSGDTFRDVTAAYAATRTSWVKATRDRFWFRMERDVFPAIGDLPVGKIEPLDVLAAVRPIQDRGCVYSAKKVIGFIAQVFDYAFALGMVRFNPALRLGKAVGDTPPPVHRPALVEPEALRPFLQALWGEPGRSMRIPIVKACLLTFARAGEVRHMRWSEIDVEAREWTYTVGKVGKAGHIVPLSTQMLALIERLRPFTGGAEFVFAGRGGVPLSDAATSQLIDDLGFKGSMTAHGARAIARTVLVETLGYPEAIVEMQLSHAPRDAHGRAYNRTTWRVERREMMQVWADWLDGVRLGSSVVAMAAE